jgi:hypothetical protein
VLAVTRIAAGWFTLIPFENESYRSNRLLAGRVMPHNQPERAIRADRQVSLFSERPRHGGMVFHVFENLGTRRAIETNSRIE